MSRHSFTLDQIIDGYMLHAESKRLSQNTLNYYSYAHRKLLKHIDGDTPIKDITPNDIAGAMAACDNLSKKTLANVHAAWSAMWSWAVQQGYAKSNPIDLVDRPKPEKRQIAPIPREDVQALLKSCEQTRSYTRSGKNACANYRPTAARDRAIILLLLDTGLRATELCTTTIANVEQRRRLIKVFGKGAKERTIPFSSQTGQAIWHYLATRDQETTHVDDPLFITTNGSPLDRHQLRRLLGRLAKATDIKDIYPHRFRHTFAINFLRNGGDIYSLQRCLGHTTLDMVKNYLAIAEADVQTAHKRASPVANWKL
jgi:integrase/recombinase XerD